MKQIFKLEDIVSVSRKDERVERKNRTHSCEQQLSSAPGRNRRNKLQSGGHKDDKNQRK